MKILVPIKRVIDYEAKIKVKPDGSGVETGGVKWIVNPFDEIAVEEALRLKEAKLAEEVSVVSIGPADVAQQLRYAMATGADRAIHVTYGGEVDSDLASKVIVEIFKRGQYGLILMGKQAIDSDAGQTPQLIATRLNIGIASFASKLQIEGSNATVTREVDGGLETVKIQLPAVISTDLRLNQPRYATLPGIMQAKKKPLEELALESLGIDQQTKLKILRVAPPPGRSAGKKLKTVEELVAALRDEAKVLA